MSDAPEKIWATVNGASTRLPYGGRQLLGGWSEDAGRPRAVGYVRADIHDALTEERDRLALANAELKPLLQNIGDGIVNMFDQLVKGNWRDDHDHDVKMNVHMLNLQDVLKQIMRFRADYLDYSEPDFTKHKVTSTEREGE